MNVSSSIIIFCIFICRIVIAQLDAQRTEEEKLFKLLFKFRRSEQLSAVKRIHTLDTEEKQRKMINTAAEKIFYMIKSSRAILENAGFVPGESEFPVDEHTREALSILLENTALVGDIILRSPDIMQPLLASQNDWLAILSWSLKFANQTNYLDEDTATLIQLVNQEMNFTVRSDDYINPYRKSYKSQKEIKENTTVSPKKNKKVKEKVRGPRMSSRDAGEL